MAADPEHAAQAYVNRLLDIHEKMNVDVRVTPLRGPLPDPLAALLPLTNARPRYLFVPTTSDWTACFDCGNRGTDVCGLVSELAFTLRVRGLRVCAVPQTIRRRERKGRWGSLIVTVDDRYTGGRTVCLTNDGGRWTFEASGTAFEFEDLKLYDAPRVKDRFSFDALCRFAAALGASLFDEAFYRADAPAYKLELVGDLPKLPEFTLEDARRRF